MLFVLVTLQSVVPSWSQASPPSGAASCWQGPFTYEGCCLPIPEIHLECFDGKDFTPERCCGEASLFCNSTPEPEPGYHALEQLMDRYRTDKGNMRHRYHKLYASLLDAQRRNSCRLLIEVGIGTFDVMKYPPGQSLRAWRDFLLPAQIVGVDIDPAGAIHGEERISTVTSVDTTEPWLVFEKLAHLEPGSADIIIDDGAHDAVLQGRTLTAMWYFLRNGGLYVIEDLDYKHGEYIARPDLKHLGQAASHHLCAMRLHEPFVFGSLAAKDASEKLAVLPTEVNFTPAGLDRMLQRNGAWYAAMLPDNEMSNMLVLPKNWAPDALRFRATAEGYHKVYNVLLHGRQIRKVTLRSPLRMNFWREALPEAQVVVAAQTTKAAACDVDVLVTSVKEAWATLLLHFAQLRRGGFFFVEDVPFSFCDGTPHPEFLGPALQTITGVNPDWFYAMTQDDWPGANNDGAKGRKLLVVRKK